MNDALCPACFGNHTIDGCGNTRIRKAYDAMVVREALLKVADALDAAADLTSAGFSAVYDAGDKVRDWADNGLPKGDHTW